jgi:predicted ATP-grasp superfamily ATP-dependent carboligase
MAYLEYCIASTEARVLIASSDSTLSVIRQHRKQLEGQIAIALAKEPALAIAMNKEQTLAIAKRLGLAVPRAVTITRRDSVTSPLGADVDTALREIGLPAVVKPVEPWVWNGRHGKRLGCELVTTPKEARLAVETLTDQGGTVLFQQFLPGRREAVSFLYARGQVHARFAQWAKRTNPPLGGVSVLRQSISIPADIGSQAERLIREIELEGYSEVEFRRDAAGKAYLMEINPRLSASVEVAVRAGVDFPYLLYQWASGEQIDTVKGYRIGGWMRDLRQDFMTTALSLRERGRPGITPPTKAVLDFLCTFFIPMGYDYMDWRDPRPAWTAAVDFAQYLSYRLLRKKS